MHSEKQYEYDAHTGEYPDIVAIRQEAETERLAGIKGRVVNGVKGMADDLAHKGVNPMVGVMLGSLVGVLDTWIEHASPVDVDAMLQKVGSIVYSWRMPPEPLDAPQPPEGAQWSQQ